MTELKRETLHFQKLTHVEQCSMQQAFQADICESTYTSTAANSVTRLKCVQQSPTTMEKVQGIFLHVSDY